ncbi:small toxic polypeptide ldrD [Escherichia coli]|nr:small toxic polypeptide ldrD [Escherichia coli]
MNLNNSRIAAKRCHYNTGGYMTLAELGMAFWHDLAAPVIAGILASMIVRLAEQAEVTCHAGVRLP